MKLRWLMFVLCVPAYAWQLERLDQAGISSFDVPMRWSAVLQQQDWNPNQFYRNGFVAYQSAQAGFVARRTAVLEQLPRLAEGCPQSAGVVARLREFLLSRRWGGRLPWSFDVDQLQLSPEQDALISVDILMKAPVPQRSIAILGAVEHTAHHELHSPSSLMHYLPAQRHPCADRNRVFVIQPDGALQEWPVAYWNRKPLSLGAGALVYVPWQTPWWRGAPIDRLNRDIAALLAESVD
jgi:hypothetical protein